jgi:hypothetical protein
MPSNQPTAAVSTAPSANETAPVELDLAGAIRLVESALASAGVAATERERMACAKTLLRLAPGAAGQPDVDDFAAVLRELGRG